MKGIRYDHGNSIQMHQKMMEKGDNVGSIESCKNMLIKLVDIFAITAIECVDIFFCKDSTLRMPWEVVDQLRCKFDLILTIGSSNDRYSALMYSGIQHDSLAAFTGSDNLTIEDAADVLGEFVNTYSGLITDKREFTDQFGILTQAVPILYTHGQSYLPFIWGVQGYVYINEHWIYIGYTIRKNRTE